MPPKRIRIRIDITSDQAIDFVNKLAAAEDDPDGQEFRARLNDSPAEVLWEYGIEVPPDLYADFQLPSAADMQGVRDAIGRGEPVSVLAGADLMFPIFWLMFPHIGLGARSD
jgi:hypothetical protein